MRSGLRIAENAFRALLYVACASFSCEAVAQNPNDFPAGSSSGREEISFPSSFREPGFDETQAPLVPTVSPMVAVAPPPFPGSAPDGGPLFERAKLTGDWWGYRSELRDSGITFDASTAQFYQGVTSGGFRQGFRYGGRNDYFLNLNGEKLGLWKGLFVDLHGEQRYGQTVDQFTGAFMPTNLMLDVPQNYGSTTALTAVKVTQFLSEDMLVYGGRINMFDSFIQPITGASPLNGFMNTAMMFNPVYGRTVPYSTYGVGFAYLQDMQPVFSFAVIDTHNTPTVSGFNTLFTNGVTLLGVLNVPTRYFDLPGHQGVSGTYSTGTYSDLEPIPYFDPIAGPGLAIAKSTGSWSFAANFDQALFVSPNDPKKIWGIFGNFGVSDGNPNPAQWFSNAGFSGVSPFQSRPQDSFGVGYYYVGVTETLKDLAPNVLRLQNEQGVELYYNVAVTPWFHITPDLQVIDPFRERADTAVVAGMRGKIDF